MNKITMTQTEYKDKIIAYLKDGGDADALLNKMPAGQWKIFAAGVILSHQNPDVELEDIMKFGSKYREYVSDILEGK